MKSRLALLVCGGALAVALAAHAQRTLSLQGAPDAPRADDAPKMAAVDPATVQGLPSARDYRPPEGVVFKATDFISENVRLTAQWFYAAGNEGRKLPTVILAPGWGATAANFREELVI